MERGEHIVDIPPTAALRICVPELNTHLLWSLFLLEVTTNIHLLVQDTSLPTVY